MGKKHDYNYFEAFVQLVDYSCQSAEILESSLKRFDPQGLSEMMTNLHGIEHAADMGKHDMMNRLGQGVYYAYRAGRHYRACPGN